jgi:SpoIIAA-like
MSSNETVELHFGPQTLAVMPKSVAIARYRDPLLVEELAAINEAMNELQARTGRLFFLADLRNVTSIPASGKSIGVKDTVQFNAVAVVGASFPLRIIATMMLRAGRTLNKAQYGFPLEFFDNEPEALDWLRNLSEQQLRK